VTIGDTSVSVVSQEPIDREEVLDLACRENKGFASLLAKSSDEDVVIVEAWTESEKIRTGSEGDSLLEAMLSAFTDENDDANSKSESDKATANESSSRVGQSMRLSWIATLVVIASVVGTPLYLYTESNRQEKEKEMLAKEKAEKQEWMQFCQDAYPVNDEIRLAKRMASFYIAAGLPKTYEIDAGGMPNVIYTEVQDEGFISDKAVRLIKGGLSQQGNQTLLSQLETEIIPAIAEINEKKKKWDEENSQACSDRGINSSDLHETIF